MNFSTTPPNDSSSRRTRSWYGARNARDVFGVELLRARGEADEVDEDDGDDAALVARLDGHSLEGLAAREAEPREPRVLLTAVAADDHAKRKPFYEKRRGGAGGDLRDREARDRPELRSRLARLRHARVARDRQEDERVLDREAVLVDEQPRASSETSLSASSKSSAVACGSQRSASSVTGHVACLPLSRSKRMSTSPAISTPVKQISPSPIEACMSPTANIPPGCRTGKKIARPCRAGGRRGCRRAPGEAVRERVAVGRDADDADHRPRGNETRSFIRISPSRTSKSRVSGACTCVDQLAEAGDQRRDAPLDRPHVEDLGHERVARLGPSHRDRPGRAVDPLEVDLRDEVVLAADLAREAVVRLEGNGLAGVDLQHGLEVRAERPDHLVAREPVGGGDGHHASGRNAGAASGATVSSST
jgi:hypothetical protein